MEKKWTEAMERLGVLSTETLVILGRKQTWKWCDVNLLKELRFASLRTDARGINRMVVYLWMRRGLQ